MKAFGPPVRYGQIWINRKDTNAQPRRVAALRGQGIYSCNLDAMMIRVDGKRDHQWAKVTKWSTMGEDRWVLVKDVEEKPCMSGLSSGSESTRVDSASGKLSMLLSWLMRSIKRLWT